MVSPATPMTRFTRCPPVGYRPILASPRARNDIGWADSRPLSQPPGSSKTMTSPRCGPPLPQYDGFCTRIRSLTMSPGSIDSEGM